MGIHLDKVINHVEMKTTVFECIGRPRYECRRTLRVTKDSISKEDLYRFYHISSLEKTFDSLYKGASSFQCISYISVNKKGCSTFDSLLSNG